ncbi:MAG: hypothetical protein M3Q68_03575, partial [Actinomycetota bacterium]|nr:hypothetical protein [Actinomycetota bacterium]
AHHEPIDFTIPSGPYGEQWELAFDTAEPSALEASRVYKAGDDVPVEARSVVVLRRPPAATT